MSQVGSGLHGVTVKGHDDRDEMGICIEPQSSTIGLEEFLMFEGRWHADGTPIKDGTRSGPGDLDKVVYSLRKWTSLAAKGNPTVLLLLFAPQREIVFQNEWGKSVQNHKDRFITKECGRRFLGYLDSQEQQMLGLRSKHTNRPELIDIYGFDTKFGYHAIRLALQGIELLETGNITLPMPEPERTWLTELRTGAYSREEALERIRDLRNDLAVLTENVDLPDKADHARLNNWLIAMHQTWWAQSTFS